jgi:putative endonuclease
MKRFHVYIMTNVARGTLYIGVTSDLARRVEQHKSKQVESFTRRYNLTMLVYSEQADRAIDAITREKQIKGLSRAKKIALIEAANPEQGSTWRSRREHTAMRRLWLTQRDSSLRSE